MFVYKFSASEAREGVGFPGTGVLGCCERLRMGVVDRAQGVCKSSVLSLLLSHLSSPVKIILALRPDRHFPPPKSPRSLQPYITVAEWKCL